MTSELPVWFTPVGRAYRYAAQAESDDPATAATAAASGDAPELTIAFHYLQSDVPDGYEHALRVVYSPDGRRAWRELPDMVLDPRENLAAAKMPQPANGVYALVATLELPALEPGWNLLAYPLPEARQIITGLASLAGSYTVLQRYDSASQSLALFDYGAATEPDAVAQAVNEFDELEPWQSYLIFATEPVTPYLSVLSATGNATLPAVDLPALVNPGLIESLLGLSPATYYGLIELPPGEAAAQPLTVAAMPAGDGTGPQTDGEDEMPICANTVATELKDGRLLYRLQVPRGTPCTVAGVTLSFRVMDAAGRSYAIVEPAPTVAPILWDNSRAQRVDLQLHGGW